MRNPGVGTQQSLKNEYMRMERGMNEKGFIGRRTESRRYRKCMWAKCGVNFGDVQGAKPPMLKHDSAKAWRMK